MKNFGSKFSPCCLIPQRYVIGIMISLSTFVSYSLRVCLSIAITEMTIKPNATRSSDECPVVDEESFVTVKDTDILYDWDETVQSSILTSFYWTYILTQVPSAWLAERVGGKHVLAAGMLVSSLVTIITPVCITSTDGNWILLVALRLIMGLAQGIVYPVMTTVLSQWVPKTEMSFWASFGFAGAILSTSVTGSLSGYLITVTKHWNIVFYFFGGVGLLWNIFWQLLCYSFPRTHPCIKEKEKQFLEETFGKDVSDKPLRTPWVKILLSLPVWSYIVAQFGHDWGWFTCVTLLPKYFNAVLKFNVWQNGLMFAMPYLAMYFVTVFSGWLSDFLILKKIVTIRTIRLIMGVLGNIFPGVFLMAASYVGCHRISAVAMFILSLVSMAFYYPGIKVNALDLSPNFAGTVMGLANGIGVFAGMIAPMLSGLMAPNQTLLEWRGVFWVACAMMVASTIMYLVFMSADVQKWNYPPEEQAQ